MRAEGTESALTLEKKCFQWKKRDRVTHLSVNVQPQFSTGNKQVLKVHSCFRPFIQCGKGKASFHISLKRFWKETWDI